MIIVLNDLPKVSLNDWYAGKHWINRKRMKDAYILIVKSQFKKVFPKDKKYFVKYDFTFKKNALDISNTIAQLKLVEDIIFEADSYKVIRKLEITSNKGDEDKLVIEVTEI